MTWKVPPETATAQACGAGAEAHHSIRRLAQRALSARPGRDLNPDRVRTRNKPSVDEARRTGRRRSC
eukprot:4236388-Pyramimonas_sp.AAC.1